MGNQTCTTNTSLVATCHSPQKQVKNRDRFIVQYSSQQRTQDIARETISTSTPQQLQVDQRRVVFISLLGFYQTWKQCPLYQLYSALVIIPMKSNWIYEPRKHRQEIQKSLLAQLSVFTQNPSDVNEFVELLKWKDSQGLVIWALDEFEPLLEELELAQHASEQEPEGGAATNCSMEALVAPFWRYVSYKLTTMTDPITGKHYKPLKQTTWWQTSYEASMSPQDRVDAALSSELEPKIRVKSILAELYFVSLKFSLMSEILRQSNPDSLNPVTFYTASATTLSTPTVDGQTRTKAVDDETECNGEDDNDDDSDCLGDGWWLSPDYDPYDIEQPIVYHDQDCDGGDDLNCNV